MEYHCNVGDLRLVEHDNGITQVFDGDIGELYKGPVADAHMFAAEFMLKKRALNIRAEILLLLERIETHCLNADSELIMCNVDEIRAILSRTVA